VTELWPELPAFGSGDLARAILSEPLVRACLGLLVANFLAGLLVAVHERTFRLGAIADWLAPCLYYLGGAVIVQLVVWSVDPSLGGPGAPLAQAVWGLVVLALLGKVLGNVRRLLPNEAAAIIPTALTDRARPPLPTTDPLEADAPRRRGPVP